MRPDMSRIVLQGGVPGKYRPFESRKIKCVPNHEGTEPLVIGRESMSIKSPGWDEKQTNVTLKPLKRWISAQVGRPWARVYAEMPNTFLPALRRSFREWVSREVAQNCFTVADGTLCFGSPYYGVQPAASEDYYVDPASGLLCRGERSWMRTRYKAVLAKKAEERAEIFRAGPDGIQHHKRDGVWYEVHVASLAAWAKAHDENPNARQTISGIRDSFMKHRMWNRETYEARALYGDADLYAVSHRSLGRRDVARLKLA